MDGEIGNCVRKVLYGRGGIKLNHLQVYGRGGGKKAHNSVYYIVPLKQAVVLRSDKKGG